MKPGDIVFDRADPRHTGVIRGTNITGRRSYAFIEWLGTDYQNGLYSYRIPFSQLRLVRPESERGRSVFRFVHSKRRRP